MDSPIDRGLTAPPAYTPFGGYARLDRLFKGLGSGDRRTFAWAVVLAGASTATVSILSLHGYGLPPIWAGLVLAGVATLAERQSIAVTERTQHSVSLLPLVFSAIVFGPLGGFAIAALSNIWDLRDSRLKWCVYTPIRGLTASAAGFLSEPAMGAYSVSKHAVVVISETLQRELREAGSRVGVTVLCPAYFPTGIVDSERVRPRELQSSLPASPASRDAEARLEKAVFTLAWQDRRAMTMEQAIEYALKQEKA